MWEIPLNLIAENVFESCRNAAKAHGKTVLREALFQPFLAGATGD
jgi:hypothetical protein